MSSPADQPTPPPPSAENLSSPRLVGDAKGIETAKKLFQHAQKAESTRNYEYAIELYAQGLAHWPDALEEGLKPLWRVASNRKAAGGKPPGFSVKRKHPTSGKDPIANLNNALFLFGYDPNSLGACETVLAQAVKCNADAAARLIAQILAATLANGKKQSASKYQTICDQLIQIGRVARDANQDAAAKDIFEACITVARVWKRFQPESSEAHRAAASASGDLAIVNGRFDKQEGFTGSLQDGDAQVELQHREKPVTSDDYRQRQIDAARRDWEENPTAANKLIHLAGLIAKTETEADEMEAIRLLEAQFEQDGNFQFRRKADDLRMRRLGRERRVIEKQLKASPDDDDLREQLVAAKRKQLEAEIRIFTGWLKQYPTDMRLKFELGYRYFLARKFDEAIPLLQQAVSDGRVRSKARLYLGRCFFEKRFYDQAIDVLRAGKEDIPNRTDPDYLNLTYWMARASEENNADDEAKKAYGEIIQADYNFRDGDARKRLEALVAGD